MRLLPTLACRPSIPRTRSSELTMLVILAGRWARVTAHRPRAGQMVKRAGITADEFTELVLGPCVVAGRQLTGFAPNRGLTSR